jgi:hypothetical protein
LRPCLAAGLPLSCATIYVKNSAVIKNGEGIFQHLSLFVKEFSAQVRGSFSKGINDADVRLFGWEI